MHRFQCFIDVGDLNLQLTGFAGRLQTSAHAGKQHEAQLPLGLAQQGFDLGHRQLQHLGGGAQVAGLQERLDHFDMT
ncbi:hypothetical protein D3C78_733170 [compost metagenome]